METDKPSKYTKGHACGHDKQLLKELEEIQEVMQESIQNPSPRRIRASRMTLMRSRPRQRFAARMKSLRIGR